VIEQYLSISRSKNFIPACIWETPVWRYLLYSTQPEVFDDVTADPKVPSQPFTVNNVIIDGIEYTNRPLSDTRTNPRSWTQEDEFLYVHYSDSFPTWLFYSHTYGTIIGRSSGKTRFFDGKKYSAGLDIQLRYEIEADNLEYSKLSFISGSYTILAEGEFDNLRDILGNDIETAYSLDGVNKVPLNTMFIEEAEITMGQVSLKAADKREKLNTPIASEIFTQEEYPKMKESFYGKNKQEVFGFCRGVPAVCVDQLDIYTDETESVYKEYRTYRVASVITRVDKIEVKMTQPKDGQNKGGDVWVTADSSNIQNIDYEKGEIEIKAIQCLPIISNAEPDYGNESYEVRVTGVFRTNGTHWDILSYLLETSLGDTWQKQCNAAEIQRELSDTGTAGLFIEKETKIFDVIETLQSSGIYGWQLHDYQGKLTVRKDDNERLPKDKKIKGIDIININEVGVSLSMNNYATTVEVEYQRNYSEKSNNLLQDTSNRTYLFPIYRNDKTYTAQSYLESEEDARARCNYLLAHFATPRLMVYNVMLFGEKWLDLRIYDIIGIYLKSNTAGKTGGLIL
jgi:hypothetical protein